MALVDKGLVAGTAVAVAAAEAFPVAAPAGVAAEDFRAAVAVAAGTAAVEAELPEVGAAMAAPVAAGCLPHLNLRFSGRARYPSSRP